MQDRHPQEKLSSEPRKTELFKDLQSTIKDIRSFFDQNANVIISRIAISLAAAGLLFFSASTMAEATVSTNVAAHQFASREVFHTYENEVNAIPEILRKSSVAMEFPFSDTKSGVCTGTVVEQVTRQNEYVAILASHCLPDKSSNVIHLGKDSVWIGQSPDGTKPLTDTPQEGYEIVDYQKVPGTDIAFLAFKGYPKSSPVFTPIGRFAIAPLDPNDTHILHGYSYPHAAGGWPVPLTLPTNGSTYSPTEYNIPVNEILISEGSSGGGELNQNSQLVAINTGFAIDWLGEQSVTLSPITPKVLESLDEFTASLR